VLGSRESGSTEQVMDTIARFTSYIGIEEYLYRVFGRTEYLDLARLGVVISLVLWAFVGVAAIESRLLVYLFRRSLPKSRDRFLETGHTLRRRARRLRRRGYILLIGGFVIDLLLIVMNGRYTMQPFAVALWLYFGVTYPVCLIVELYGRAFEGAATRAE
jgi:hypothetical protein